MTKREELAKAYLQEKWSCAGTVRDILRAKTKRSLWWDEKAEAFRYIDAILAALAEPSEEMVDAALFHAFVHDDNRAKRAMVCMWQAMLKAV